VLYGQKLGLSVEVTSARRVQAEQQRLYAQYLAGRSSYPVAAPGQSAHQYGVAWDSTVPPAQQETWNAVRRAFGWLVPTNDLIHAEVPGWQSYRSGLRYS
jgi:LAS superfamily LD-carboxypeptidase LdcB